MSNVIFIKQLYSTHSPDIFYKSIWLGPFSFHYSWIAYLKYLFLNPNKNHYSERFLVDKKCLKKTWFSTSFWFCSNLKSNNKKWMKPFLFFHQWTWNFKYIKHFTTINSVLNYVYLWSWKTRTNVFVKVNFGGKNNS